MLQDPNLYCKHIFHNKFERKSIAFCVLNTDVEPNIFWTSSFTAGWDQGLPYQHLLYIKILRIYHEFWKNWEIWTFWGIGDWVGSSAMKIYAVLVTSRSCTCLLLRHASWYPTACPQIELYLGTRQARKQFPLYTNQTTQLYYKTGTKPSLVRN